MFCLMSPCVLYPSSYLHYYYYYSYSYYYYYWLPTKPSKRTMHLPLATLAAGSAIGSRTFDGSVQLAATHATGLTIVSQS